MIHDLIYAQEDETELRNLIEITYPQAVIESASDCIHRGRFSVNIENVDRDDWHLWIMIEGFHHLSLGFQMRYQLKDDPTLRPLMEWALEAQKRRELETLS